jgi:hypothetical protein
MANFDWKSLVGAVAPTIATALGGPFAGIAVKKLAVELLGNPDASEKDVAAALSNASPDVLVKLKELDHTFEKEMAELGVDLEKVAAADRASARDMQKTNKSWAVPLLAGLTVAGFFAVVGWVLSGNVALDNTLTGFILGQVSTKAEQVYNFFFGSSVGSKEKTQHMAALTGK